MKRILSIFVIALLLLSIIPITPRAHASEGSKIWTDKEDYDPTEAVTIFGWGFKASANLAITIGKPDNTGDMVYAVTNDVGGFVCTYQLDGMRGNYTVTATDGINTATTTFTEGTITPELSGYTLLPSPGWTHGDVKGYYEGQWVPYKVEITNTKTQPFALIVYVQHDYFNGIWYGLDNDRNFQMWRNGVPEAPIVSAPVANGWESGIQQLEFHWVFTINQNDNCTLMFETHIAIGAHNYPGSKTHTHIHDIIPVPDTPISGGHRDVAIVVQALAPCSVTFLTDPSTSGSITFMTNTYTNGLSGTFSYGTSDLATANPPANYAFNHWEVTGNVAVSSTTDNPTTVTITCGGTLKAVFTKIQYQITVTATPAGAIGGTFTVTYTKSGTTYTDVLQTTTWTEWVDAGTTVTVGNPQDPINDGPGTRYVFDHYNPSSSVSMSGPATITLVYKTQYKITVTATPAGAVGGTFDVTYTHCGTTYTNVQKTTTWTEWVDAGTTVTVSNPEDPINDGPGTRYVFDHYNPSDSVSMTGPTTITLVYTTQYYLTVVSPYDTPGGQGWYDEGDTAYATLAYGTENITPNVRAVFTGWSVDASGTGLTSDPIIMDGPKTAVADWKIQYYLDVVTDPSHLPPIPGADWYNNCTWVRLTAPQYVPSEAGEGGVRYVFNYWDVDGTSQGAGVNPIDLHMNAPHIATAYFVLQYLVTFDQTGLDGTATGTVATVDSSAKTYADLPFNEWVDNDTSVSYDYQAIVSSSASGERFRLDSVTGPTSPIMVTSPVTVIGNYVTQYYLTVTTSPPGVNSPTGAGWYDSGPYASISTAQYVDIISGSSRYRFDGWTTTDMTEITDPSATATTVRMDKAKTLTANYVIQYYLTVTDDIGGLSGVFAQSGWFDENTNVSLTAPAFVPIAPGAQYRFSFWDVDTVTVPGNPIGVHMDAPHTATAHYVKQYYLTVKTDPNGLNPAPIGEGWYDECTHVNLIAPPVSYLGTVEYVFTYWQNDSSSTSNDIIHIHMDAPHTATAHYMLSGPRHLDAEPPVLIDLSHPVSTEWQELYPDYSRHYRIQSWHDTNLNGKLNPSDYIDIWDMDHQWQLKPSFWHIDNITVTMKVTNINTGKTMYLEFEGGWAEYEHVIVEPDSPLWCTQWHEVYPNYSRQFNLEKWYDNCNSKLSYCDRIILRDMTTQERAEYHVEEVKTDLIISPRTTIKTICKSKDVVAQGYTQIFCETIHNYYSSPTDFTIACYYNGLQPIGNKTITLNPLDSGDAIVSWAQTATWPKGTYSFNITINNYVNNTLLYSVTFPITFKISILGDVNGDGLVDVSDIAMTSAAFGSYLCGPRWNPSVDIDGDGIIDVMDLAIVAKNFGKHDP